MPSKVRRWVLEHDRHRPHRHVPRAGHRHAGQRDGRPLSRRHRPRQRSDAFRAVHERPRAGYARIRAMARPGVADRVPRPVRDGLVSRNFRHRGVCGAQEEVLDRREPRGPLPRGGGSRERADADADRRPRDGRVAHRSTGQDGGGAPRIRRRPVHRHQRRADEPDGGDERGQRHRRAQRRRHLTRPREPHHRHQEPRRVRGAGHGAARPRGRVPLPVGPRPARDDPLLAALQARL
mmetsp:Transcript_14723/g.33647  ORF Transcript_14723/g.33647 Transcript_14723/m.33647 type:complete len:236 (+) Transcript_14723:280-987(+)